MKQSDSNSFPSISPNRDKAVDLHRKWLPTPEADCLAVVDQPDSTSGDVVRDRKPLEPAALMRRLHPLALSVSPAC